MSRTNNNIKCKSNGNKCKSNIKCLKIIDFKADEYCSYSFKTVYCGKTFCEKCIDDHQLLHDHKAVMWKPCNHGITLNICRCGEYVCDTCEYSHNFSKLHDNERCDICEYGWQDNRPWLSHYFRTCDDLIDSVEGINIDDLNICKCEGNLSKHLKECMYIYDSFRHNDTGVCICDRCFECIIGDIENFHWVSDDNNSDDNSDNNSDDNDDQ